MEVDKQLKFKSHECMQVEFISNNVDVMTHDCLSSVALALVALSPQDGLIGPLPAKCWPEAFHATFIHNIQIEKEGRQDRMD